MAFVPRSFEQILLDMVNHVRANTTLTDFTVGSVIRTILEAAALEDDEQYYQMVQLLNAFRIATATGSDLDERAADMNETRLPAQEAAGSVVYRNDNLIKNVLRFDIASGVASFQLDSSDDFPLAPPNYTIRIGEGTPQVEDLTVTGNNTGTDTLTLLLATVNAHKSGERVALVTGGDQIVGTGTQVQVPASGFSLAVKYASMEVGVVVAGNYESSRVNIKALEVGSQGNTSTGNISQFTSAPPFTGAAVHNPVDITGGRDLETDDDFRDRLMHKYAKLSRGVPEAIEQTVIGVEDTNTGERIVTAKLREDFILDEHTLFIDTRSGLVPDFVVMPTSTLAVGAVAGVTSALTVVNATNYPMSGLLVLGLGTTDAEVVTYTSKGPGAILNLTAPVAHNHAIGQEAILVVDLGTAEDGQNFFKIPYYPIKKNSFEIYDDSSGVFTQRVSGTDYFLNRTNGDLEYSGAGLAAGTRVLANVSYYTGVLQLVQKVLDGDPDDSINYPGVVAGGVIVHVDVPTLRKITIIVSISVKNGYDEVTLAQEVRRAVAAYVDSLAIGENVIRAKIIARAMSVEGVENAILKSPTADLVILEDEMAVSFDSNGNTLVTVY